VIGTLDDDGWAVTFSTARRELGFVLLCYVLLVVICSTITAVEMTSGFFARCLGILENTDGQRWLGSN